VAEKVIITKERDNKRDNKGYNSKKGDNKDRKRGNKHDNNKMEMGNIQ